MNIKALLPLLLLCMSWPAYGRIVAPAAKRCAGSHSSPEVLYALSTKSVLNQLIQFRSSFWREYSPQDVFVVGTGEKTASLIATLQASTPDYALNLPIKLSPSLKSANDLSRDEFLKITDYLELKLPKLRSLSHRTLLLVETADNAGQLPVLKEIFERYYRQYGFRVYVETVAVGSRETGNDRFLIGEELNAQITNGPLSTVREHDVYLPQAQKHLDQAPTLASDRLYPQVLQILRGFFNFERFGFDQTSGN